MPDWNMQCEAISRKTNKRCPHRSRWQIPSTLAAHLVCDKRQFVVMGRPVHLCPGHASSWWARQKRLLTIRLIDGGYLSAYNHHGFGSIVTGSERIYFNESAKVAIPKDWGPREWSGRIPQHVADALGLEALQAEER